MQKSYTNYDRYTFKQNEVLLETSIYFGLAILESSKFLLYETYFRSLQLYFGRQNLLLHYMGTDSFVLSVNTKDIIKHLKKIEDLFDFINLNENHEVFSNDYFSNKIF